MNSLFKTITGDKSDRKDDRNVVPIQEFEGMAQSIFIRDLELEMSIGVMDEEKSKKQRVIVNAELDVVPPSNWREDDINDVVSYADMVEQIQAIANSGHHNLVETFAEKIIEKCFENKAVLSATIGVEKPDVISNAGSVGAIISRDR